MATGRGSDLDAQMHNWVDSDHGPYCTECGATFAGALQTHWNLHTAALEVCPMRSVAPDPRSVKAGDLVKIQEEHRQRRADGR